jgi:hypothetical protein
MPRNIPRASKTELELKPWALDLVLLLQWNLGQWLRTSLPSSVARGRLRDCWAHFQITLSPNCASYFTETSPFCMCIGLCSLKYLGRKGGRDTDREGGREGRRKKEGRKRGREGGRKEE